MSSGKKINVEISDRGYTVRLVSHNGTGWRPAIHADSPIWEDARKWESLPKSFEMDEVEWNQFRAEVEQSEMEEVLKQDGKEESKPDNLINEKALNILKTEDPIRFIIDSCTRYVLGAEKAFRKLVCCVAVQDVKSSAGLHPRLSGESGMGKSLVALVFAHHLPPEMVCIGSSSNLAVFYHGEGNKVFRVMDDYIPGGNETIDTIIKQTSTFYHQPYAHKTVRDLKPVVLYVGSEQTWAITSVDASQDVQVLNRQIPINLDDTETLTQKVNRVIIDRYGAGIEQFFLDETVEICREIWKILRSNGYINIKVPFSDRIEWLDNSNRRNPSMFMDLVIAHTAVFRYQREHVDGYYLSTEDDYTSAVDLFKDKDAEEIIKRLTKKERILAEFISKSKDGTTREDAAQYMKVSVQRIGQLVNGDKGKGGLASKMPGLIIEETINTEKSETSNKSVKVQVIKLVGYVPIDGYGEVVRLKELKDETRDETRIDPNKETSNGERDERERESIVKEIKEKEREKKLKIPKKRKSISLSQDQKHPLNPCSMSTDSETDPCLIPLKTLENKEKVGMGPNPRRDLPTPSLPGCGYPARERRSSDDYEDD